MKVLQIIDSLQVGGAEKLLIETVPKLVEKGFEVDVLLLNGIRTPFYNELESMNNCNIYSLGRSYYNPLYILKMIPFLKKYDLVHVHLFPAQYLAVFAKLFVKNNVKLFFTEHSTSNRRLSTSGLRFMEKWIYSKYSKITCITKEVKQNLIDKLSLDKEKLIVIQNGINLEKINEANKNNRVDFGFLKDDRIIIMVAGFRIEKDQDTLIKTMSLIAKNYKLLLIGDGQRRIILENLIKKEQLEDRVFLLGIRSDIFSLYKMCNIAVLSSHWEGFGLAAVEAMACGIPTIASNVDGLAQVVEDGGVLFEKGNTFDLKTKIEMLEDTTYYSTIIESGLKKAQDYSLDFMVEKLINIYKSV